MKGIHVNLDWGGGMGRRKKIWRSLAMTLASALVWPVLAGAQMRPPLKLLPPKKERAAPAAVTNATSVTAAVSGAAVSPWVNLPNQPPLLDYTDCGTGNPIL